MIFTQVGPSGFPVAVMLDNAPATVLFAGEAPGIVAGVMQVNVQIPPNAPTGNLPIQASVGANTSQNGATVSFQYPDRPPLGQTEDIPRRD